jgi:hypothetical protein
MAATFLGGLSGAMAGATIAYNSHEKRMRERNLARIKATME